MGWMLKRLKNPLTPLKPTKNPKKWSGELPDEGHATPSLGRLCFIHGMVGKFVNLLNEKRIKKDGRNTHPLKMIASNQVLI